MTDHVPYDWPHQTHDPDAIGGPFGGDVCPWCGEALRRDEDGVDARNGTRGDVLDLAPKDVSVPVLHPDCHQEWIARNTRSLAEFGGGRDA